MGKDRPRDIHLGASTDYDLYGNQSLRDKINDPRRFHPKRVQNFFDSVMDDQKFDALLFAVSFSRKIRATEFPDVHQSWQSMGCLSH
jgi:hypothetical protein